MHEQLALSVILVVGLRLGCLNHALLTREAIRSRSLPFAGWIANKLQTEMPLADGNIETLAGRFAKAPLAVVPAGVSALQTGCPPWMDKAVDSLVSP
jgi:dethiobiotin synthetase